MFYLEHFPFYLDKSNQQQNRPIADGYVKLAAESVAINPLESKND